MSVSAIKLMDPNEIEGMPDSEVPLLVLPQLQQSLSERATRFDQLAKGSLTEWLAFCGKLARAQASSIEQLTLSALDENVVKESFKHGMPPASISTWKAGDDWQQAMNLFVTELQKQELPKHVGDIVQAFKAADRTLLQQQAQDYLNAREDSVKPEWAPLLGAILQIIWMKRVEGLKSYAAHYKGQSSLCPVCGSHPVASVVRVGDRDAHRYLACSLCLSEWYGPRARCTNCETPKEVSILGESQESLVQGECCDDCHGYLKIMYQSRDPLMDVVADDLASIQVDLALANEDYLRTGRNLFLMTGGQSDKKDT